MGKVIEYKGIKYEKESYCILEDRTVKSMIAELRRLIDEEKSRGDLFQEYYDRYETGKLAGFRLAMAHIGIFMKEL